MNIALIIKTPPKMPLALEPSQRFKKSGFCILFLPSSQVGN